MQIVLGEFDFLFVYVDDIIVYSHSINQHLKHLQVIFERLIQFNLTINIEKSQFTKKEIEFLSYTINLNGVRPSNQRTEIIEKYPLPTKIKHIKKFLGMVNHYNRFIPRLTQLQLH